MNPGRSHFKWLFSGSTDIIFFIQHIVYYKPTNQNNHKQIDNDTKCKNKTHIDY